MSDRRFALVRPLMSVFKSWRRSCPSRACQGRRGMARC